MADVTTKIDELMADELEMSKSDTKAEEPKKEEAEDLTINMVEFAPFEGNMKTMFLNTMEMCETINALFSPFMSDYVGSKIHIANGSDSIMAINQQIPFNSLYVDLYFKDNGQATQGKKNIELKNTKKFGTDLGSRYNMFLGSQANRAYNITTETMKMVEEFMIPRNTRILDFTEELTQRMGTFGSKEEVMVRLSGLSLQRIVEKIYGTKTKTDRFEYQIMVVNNVANIANEFLLQITQLDMKTVQDMQQSLGLYNANPNTFHVVNRSAV